MRECWMRTISLVIFLGRRRDILAYQIAFKLGITRVWKIMGGFWHLDIHSLKTGRDKAESTLKIQAFEEKIKPIFG